EGSVGVCAQEQRNRARSRDPPPTTWSIEAGDEQGRCAGDRNHKADVRKECPVVVHYFGEGKERRREKRDQEPEQAKADHACLLENGSHDRRRADKDCERKTDPKTRIARRNKR